MQLQIPKEWINGSASSQKGKLLQEKKKKTIHLLEFICNPHTAQYYFVTHNWQ